VRITSSLPKKTVYGKCPRCKTKSALEVVSGNPGKEKFKCNQCYYKFGMEEL
jgi:transposase-like protein